jgi:tRNA pseudouridine38-40 synthase
MQKIKLTISYDGSQFFGSQKQPNIITVQGVLEEVLAILNIHSKLEFSGRTDKDVHAFRQSVSFFIQDHWKDLAQLKQKIVRLLPHSIAIRAIQKVDNSFHARFSAKKREYRYLFTNKKVTPFNGNYIGYYKEIEEERILEAIEVFIGRHDFELFSKTGSEPESTVREIYDIKLFKHKDIYVLKFCANSYLRSQIRMIVDAVMKVSCGKLSVEDIKLQLAKKKQLTWTLASPHGLYLSKVIY